MATQTRISNCVPAIGDAGKPTLLGFHPLTDRFCQSTFYDGLLILNKYTFTWMVDRFFFESLGVSYDSLVRTIQISWKGPNSPPLGPMERIIYKARPSSALRVRRLIFSFFSANS